MFFANDDLASKLHTVMTDFMRISFQISFG